MKTFLFAAFIFAASVSYGQSTTDTLTFSHGEFAETYSYSVFKKGDQEIMFYNPDLKEFGNDNGQIYDACANLSFIVTYSPWENNDSYNVIEGIRAVRDASTPVFVTISQSGMEEFTLSYKEVTGQSHEIALTDYAHLQFNGKDLFGKGQTGSYINKDVLEEMKTKRVFVILDTEGESAKIISFIVE